MDKFTVDDVLGAYSRTGIKASRTFGKYDMETKTVFSGCGIMALAMDRNPGLFWDLFPSEHGISGALGEVMKVEFGLEDEEYFSFVEGFDGFIHHAADSARTRGNYQEALKCYEIGIEAKQILFDDYEPLKDAREGVKDEELILA